ncbi:MAG: NADH-quinone oxidoreductase subunit H [Myxococcales bacterium]|nr:NADH-quinone oxidoreductase subunit H [Myxococcales bacterium]
MGEIVIWALVKIAILFGFALNLSAVLTWMERRQSAMMQDRMGPVKANISGVTLWGLLHPLADALKLATKEDFVPPKAHKAIFVLAPLFAIAPVVMVFAVIPFAPPVCLKQLTAIAPRCVAPEHMQIARIDIGLLYVFAIASISVYGAALAGWASYNNYSLLGGLRASAQMLSYEITMGMALIGTFLVFGTLEPGELVLRQSTIAKWGIVQQPLGFILFFFAAIAETKRAPFDLPEGESEIVGYFVEYSGARFMTFFLGEFLEIVFVGCMVTTIFLGGWQAPGLAADGLHIFGLDLQLPHIAVVGLGLVTFTIKVFIVCFLQLAIRWSLPRMRYDQLMRLGWKGMLPASIINVIITAAVVLWMSSPVKG